MRSKTGGKGYIKLENGYNPRFDCNYIKMPLVIYDKIKEVGGRKAFPLYLFIELSKKAITARSNEIYATSRELAEKTGHTPTEVSAMLRLFDDWDILSYNPTRGRGLSKIILGSKGEEKSN